MLTQRPRRYRAPHTETQKNVKAELRAAFASCQAAQSCRYTQLRSIYWTCAYKMPAHGDCLVLRQAIRVGSGRTIHVLHSVMLGRYLDHDTRQQCVCYAPLGHHHRACGHRQNPQYYCQGQAERHEKNRGRHDRTTPQWSWPVFRRWPNSLFWRSAHQSTRHQFPVDCHIAHTNPGPGRLELLRRRR